MEGLPARFLERLCGIIPPQYLEGCVKNFSAEKILTVRVNTLKTNRDSILKIFKEHGIDFEQVPWYREAFVLNRMTQSQLKKTELLQKGLLYMQSLSSMLPALILNPQPGEDILDMCAAPGSKATQLASLMKNQGTIFAVDNVKDRYYKLRSIISLLGAEIVEPKFADARKLRIRDRLFDRILLDAPCSSEGRFKISDKKTLAYWSPRKIKEMVHKQRGLLLSATRLLKSGGVLVYCTCTFAPEENEGVLNWLLKKTGDAIEVTPINLKTTTTYPAIIVWGQKKYHAQISRCARILPVGIMEGFFIAKLVKRG